jgi:hypothetical protein
VHAATPDDTGVLESPSAFTFDHELRQDLAHAAWLMAAVTLPGLALLAVVA